MLSQPGGRKQWAVEDKGLRRWDDPSAAPNAFLPSTFNEVSMGKGTPVARWLVVCAAGAALFSARTVHLAAMQRPMSDPPTLPPRADAGGPYRWTAGRLIAFDGSASVDGVGGKPVLYAWEFDDGDRADGPVVSHAYA